LGREQIASIVILQLERVKERLSQQGVQLALSEEAIAFIGNQGYDPIYGARPLKRAIQHFLLDPLSLDLLEGKFPEGATIQVTVKDGGLHFR
jgi:ATP-dependent Clp protease ATP-binding subunit ClpB